MVRREGWDEVQSSLQLDPSGGGALILKEIELENFKSFGRHLRLPLLPGYTAITGPNGSGKSNLSDAVLFVLGPKSSKVIRAGRLTDLVYNGGEDGRPADYCRVSLVFDNGDRTIPLDSDEVRLTRYVGLSPSVEGGYNSYFYINGRKATLSAFDSLLADAKISAEGYNIVQQGDVGKTVEMSPVERRRVLEDIAGISRFDEDIEKAEEERQCVEENLGRIEIILGEIKRQLRQLDKDRQAALNYRELREELDRARVQHARKEVQILRHQLASAVKQADRYRAERATLREKRGELLQALKGAEEELERLEQDVADMGGEEFRKLKESLDALRVDRARAQDSIERGKEEVKELRAEGLTLRKESDRVSREIRSSEDEMGEAGEVASELEAELRSKEGEIAALEETASQSDARILELQKALVSLDKEFETVEGEQRILTLEREKLTQRMENLDSRIAEVKEEKEAREFEVQDAEWQLQEATSGGKAASKDLNRLRQRHNELEVEEKELSKQSSELEMAVRSLSRDYSKLKAEAEAVDNVQKGYSAAVTAIIEARDTGTLTGIRGTIAELARVEPQHEVALNVAAGARMQAIVVDDDGAAADAIGYLKSRKLGRAIFLPLNKMLLGRPKGKALLAVKEALGFAIDLVSFEEEYRNAFWYVFGDTVVVRNLAEARRLMGGVRLVTLDGQLVEASGAMIGGQVRELVLRFGQGAEGRLPEVGEELRKASEELSKVNDRLRDLREEVGHVGKEIRELQGVEERKRSKAEVLGKRLKEFRGQLSGTARTAQRRDDERREAARTLGELEARLEEVGAKVEEVEQRRKDRRAEMAKTTPRRISLKLRQLQADKLSLAERFNQAISKRETIANRIALQKEKEEEVVERLAEIERRISLKKEEEESRTQELSRVEEELLGLRKMEGRLMAEKKGVRDRRDSAFKEKTELEARLAKLDTKLETTEDFLLSLESQTTSLQEKLREAESQTDGLEDIAEELPPLEDIKATIIRCEKTLDSIGAVNLRALEDYEAQQSRHDELKQELSRLKSERKNLLRVVKELEARKRQGLLRVFHAMRDNFVEIFAKLAEGGEAELLLENEEDPFQGGLIVRARPPNKRFLRLEALSGGEKSLVSMAFIFALQEYDPSPFYFLDEVDQNLDAINAERIARMIGHNSTAAQFIQISLRKVSLKEADHIIGVTMGGRGVSEVVMKVNLEDMVEEAPKAEAMT